MGDHSAQATAIDYFKNAAKTLVTTVGVTATSAAVALVADPTTAREIAAVVPTTYQPLVPLFFAFATIFGTYWTKNHPLPKDR